MASWSTSGNNQGIPNNTALNAISSNIFTAKTTIPNNGQLLTKSRANQYLYIDTSVAGYASKTANQIVVKSNLVGTIAPIAAFYSASSCTEACNSGSSTTVYTNNLALNGTLFSDQQLTTPASVGYYSIGGDCYTQTPVPVTGLSWSLTVDNACNPTPWEITNSNYTIKYYVSDSQNCGGTCGSTQSGTATATITVGGSNVNMGLDFDGIGELQASNFELIKFKLDGVQVADAHAAGGGLQCQMGPVVKTFTQAPPYFLAANSVHTLLIEFTTNDNLFHVGSYYEVDLSFATL
jgi:hypothetical protein